MGTGGHKHVATEEVHATPFDVDILQPDWNCRAKSGKIADQEFFFVVILEDFLLFWHYWHCCFCKCISYQKVPSILEVNSGSSCVSFPTFHFLFHAAARDTFPLIFDAQPDSATTQPGKGFYDTAHQLLWVCQPLGELYTPSTCLRKASCIQ